MITPSSLANYPNTLDIKSQITTNYIVNESKYISDLLDYLDLGPNDINQLEDEVLQLINEIRQSSNGSGIDDFLQTYSLDTKEGIILMCLAEALLRIPDSASIDALIEDKLSNAAWDKHISKSDSLFVNASTWGLMLSGKVASLGKDSVEKPASLLGKMVDKLGEPVIRAAMYQAMKIMGKQFVLGESIKDAINEGKKSRRNGDTHSFDMLGEAALTKTDAKRYHESYLDAIKAIGSQITKDGGGPKPSISIKLSALHPRYEESQRESILKELYHSVILLIEEARKLSVPLTIDAEEMNRLELSLSLFEKLYLSAEAKNWGQLGLVVQTYSSRALPVLHWLNLLAKENNTSIPIRLVKGAYWDSEIKICQQDGLEGYPVFTRKVNTDISYLACAQYLLSHAKKNIFPQFATHNAQTLATILFLAKKYNHHQFEFQRLHGMGEELYKSVDLKTSHNSYIRIYAPVGKHKNLLPYLVRRLLENGANTSFVHKLLDSKTPAKQLAEHPINTIKKYPQIRNTKIEMPENIFGDRSNSIGTNLNISLHREHFAAQIQKFQKTTYEVSSIINGDSHHTPEKQDIVSPYNHHQKIGHVCYADNQQVTSAIESAKKHQLYWNNLGVQKRADILFRIADLFEEHKYELISICIKEAGKSYQDCIDEVREAVDFCKYYAHEAETKWQHPISLNSPTGETNHLLVEGRGVFVCISPWNFPLAIFTGQIVAALVTGNTVIAKPAESTNIIAYKAVKLMHQAGIPKEALQLICGIGAHVGKLLIESPLIDGVCFTGSTQTAKLINLTLAQKEGAIIPLIAETGGQNAMIVDSTALPEQAVTDIVNSAFMSAGQRCSALRVLFVQSDIAESILELLKGAMQSLVIGSPEYYSTDVSCVIDKTAQTKLASYIETMKSKHQLIYQSELNQLETQTANFIPPTAIEINSISDLSNEQFGPILHIIRFKRKDLSQIINDINQTGFGLTFGIHTRNETLYKHIANNINAGNIYINRNQIGAVVGVQPFGGHGLSGTGPKAGGPNYLARFINEKTISNNITAIGGDASLLAMNDEILIRTSTT